MKILSNIKRALGLEEATDHGDVAGFVVRERATGQIVHSEHFESGRLPADRVVGAMERKREALAQKYSGARFEIEHGLFNNVGAFHHFFPEAKKD